LITNGFNPFAQAESIRSAMPDVLKDSFTKDIPAKGVIVLLLFSTFIKIFTIV
jgi:hypothetical protein